MEIRVFSGNHPSVRVLFSFGFKGSIFHTTVVWLLCNDDDYIFGGIVFNRDESCSVVVDRNAKESDTYKKILVDYLKKQFPTMRISFSN